MSDGKVATRPVAIVGGGFSGVMTAVHLAARGIGSLLIDGSGRLGRGLPYATTEPAHLLNVSTDKMSAWPDRPRHFADWCGDAGTSFVERRSFGTYLGEQLAVAGDHVRRVEAMATGAEPTEAGWRLQLSDGQVFEVAALVLANGNQPPSPWPGTGALPAGMWVNDPWSDEARAAVAKAAAAQSPVLILGTGLTMVDTVLSLIAAGHQAPITAVSRRGLIPRAHIHPPAIPAPASLDEVPLGSVLALSRWLRRRTRAVGFRAAIDALRPHSHAIWRSFGIDQRRRFMRHVQPWWGAHRHRIAPQVAERIQAVIESGQLETIAGRVRDICGDGDCLSAAIALRGGGERQLEAGVGFNCTGPLGDTRRTRDPLLTALLQSGEVRRDPLGLGLLVDERSRAGTRLWALGPLTKGMYWEIIAVPDIRHQAEGVAAAIAEELIANGPHA